MAGMTGGGRNDEKEAEIQKTREILRHFVPPPLKKEK